MNYYNEFDPNAAEWLRQRHLRRDGEAVHRMRDGDGRMKTMRSEELIERARKKMAERDGERVKVRLPFKMWKDIERCATACGTDYEDLVLCFLRNWEKGKYDGVEYDEKSILGTRENSRTGCIRVPLGFGREGMMVRRAIASGVVWCEKRIPTVNPQKGTEKWIQGRDYFLKTWDE